ncbi:uncharacterized protein TNCV_728651 [Trichonephila clavipes]|nr:uncharacterized protein TNCV_728651 [Trichonephila clavipes]
MLDSRIFQWLDRQLRETLSFHITRHDVGRQRAVRSPNLEESILNIVAVKPESSTRSVAHHISVNHETVCRVVNGNRLHIFHFQRVQALNSAGYLLRLPVGDTAMLKPLRFDIFELQGMKLLVRLINATNERRVVQGHETTPLRVKGDIEDVSSELDNGATG